LFRGINEFRKRYKSRTNRVNDENGGLVADIHSILARLRNYFCQVLNVHGLMKVGRLKYSRYSLVPEATAFEAEMAIEKLQIPSY
jgi:hypothetical protein